MFRLIHFNGKDFGAKRARECHDSWRGEERIKNAAIQIYIPLVFASVDVYLFKTNR